LVSRFLDDALSQRERQDLLAHLGECPDCAATLARYRQATVLLGRLGESAPSPRVREAVLAERPSAARNGWRAALAGLAACLLIGGAVAFSLVPVERGPATGLDTGATPSAENTLSGGDGQDVVEALRKTLGPADGPALPSYLPRGAKVERVSLGRPPQSGGPYEVDLALRLEDGKSLLLRQRSKEPKAIVPTPPSRSVVISGREWRYLPRGNASAREAATYVLVGEVNGSRYELESSIPLEDLVRVAESIR
jgi:hypothetical protein